jgi:predicted AlkP superfamily pyrophosphatase or phosphodiesterase
MVTGLYQETHGIINNEMFDPVLNDTFENWIDTGAVNTRDQKWYGQNPLTEPIWITNQKQGNGRKSAASWVGGGVEFNGQAAINIPYNSSRPYNQLIDQFIGLFVGEEGINFGAVYFDEPDATGHKYGPYSKQMEDKLYELDQSLGYLMEQLQSHHLYEKLNLIVTSDHGMEQVSEDKTIYLSEHIDIGLFKAYGHRTSYNLFLSKGNFI